MSAYSSDNLVMGAGGDDGDLLAYNAYPAGHSSMSAAFDSPLAAAQPPPTQQFEPPPPQQPPQQPRQPPPPPPQKQPQQQQQMQLQQQQQMQLQQQMHLQLQQQQQQQQMQPYRVPQGSPPTMVSLTHAKQPLGDDDPGYLELMWQRRRDVAKLGILSLVVLLAISLHSAAWHYLREYIETAAKLTYLQEVGLRLAYPAVVVFLLWNLKATL